MPFLIVRNDITKMAVDAVVNTANPRPVIGAGVDSAIHAKAGARLLKARYEIGKIAPGDAAVTPAYDLDAKYVIHTVGPVWQGGDKNEEELLRSCYAKSMALAYETGCASVAIPLISTGNYGFPKDRALHIAISEIGNFVMSHEMKVYLVVFDRNAFVLSEKLFNEIESYIDEKYVEEYSHTMYADVSQKARRCFEDIQEYDVSVIDDAKRSAALSEENDLMPAHFGIQIKTAKIRSLDDVMDQLEETFSEALFRLIDEKGLTDPQVYKNANIDRKHFSKIRKNKNYKPSKETALALAIALGLNLDETRDLIGRAGYALSHSSIFDIIVEYFIISGNYDIFELNEALFAYGQPTIGC